MPKHFAEVVNASRAEKFKSLNKKNTIVQA